MIVIGLLLLIHGSIGAFFFSEPDYQRERDALLEFRERVPDCLTDDFQDDEYLMSWLRVEKFDVNKAEQMLRKSMEWRREWRVDELKNLELPGIFKRYMTHGLSGFDKEGAPVVIIPFVHLDAAGLYQVLGGDELITGTIKLVEDYRRLARQQALEFGPNAGKLFLIVDMTGFHCTLTTSEVGKLGKQLVQMYRENYPGLTKHCFLINATTTFKLAYKTMSGFLGNLKSHIKLYKQSEIKTAREELLNYIDADQLPAYFGGTMTDPDGNPACLTKINYGGEVPDDCPFEKRLVDLLGKYEDLEKPNSEVFDGI